MQRSQLFRVGLHEIYVSFDLRHAIFPIVLVLDGNMAVKFLTLEFFQAGSNIDDTLTSDHHWSPAKVSFVFEMNAHHTTIKNTQTLDGLEMRGAPVP